jgi:hypothetical protein
LQLNATGKIKKIDRNEKTNLNDDETKKQLSNKPKVIVKLKMKLPD